MWGLGGVDHPHGGVRKAAGSVIRGTREAPRPEAPVLEDSLEVAQAYG